jgi:uncharacterized protein YbgA (DUF1722 family)/uncharacterized protein YbbK (DUF523 family)
MQGHVRFLPVCPECEIELGVPREPVRVESDGRAARLVQPATGRDLTEKMTAFCTDYLDSLEAVDGFVLKSRSPSCGIKDVKVYAPGKKAVLHAKGRGFFGNAVLGRYGDAPVEDEGRLTNFTIREHFLTALFALARFRSLRAGCTMSDLVRFHAEHKFILMAYSQKELKTLGGIVANRKKRPLSELLDAYARRLRAAFVVTPRFTSNVNVIMHALGYFSKGLQAEEKRYLLQMLDRYRKGKIPLSAVIGVVRAWIVRFDTGYLREQRYFSPYPEELVEITDSGKGRAVR